MKAVLYARVSSKEQLEGYSIDAQKRAFRLLCRGRQWEPVAEYIDEGKSARTDKLSRRPAFQRALADAQAHAYDVLVVHKLDRFSRNLQVTLQSFDALSKAGVAFVSISEQVDYSTPSGKVYLAMLGAFAQFYSDNLSQETKKGKHERKAQGLYNGLLPFGVMKGPDGVPMPHNEIWVVKDKKGNILEERNPTYDGLALAFQLAAQGETDKAIAQILNARGYRTHGTHGSNPFSEDTVGGIVQNRFYVGELPDGKGGWLKGKHCPIVPLELFQAAQEARARRRALPQGTRSNAQRRSLSSLAQCAACGHRLRVVGPARMLCNRRVDRNGCRQPSARLPVLESQMGAYLRAFRLPEDYREKMLAFCHGTGPETGVEAEIGSIKARIARIKDLYAWGDMGKAEYLAERQQLQGRLAKLTVTKAEPDYLDRVSEFLRDLSLAWEAADQEQKNRLAAELFDTVWVEDGVIRAVTPRPEMVPFFDLIYAEAVKHRVAGTAPTGVEPSDSNILLGLGLYPVQIGLPFGRPCPRASRWALGLPLGQVRSRRSRGTRRR